MENPETSEIKFRENQRDNQEWRIQRHQQHWKPLKTSFND